MDDKLFTETQREVCVQEVDGCVKYVAHDVKGRVLCNEVTGACGSHSVRVVKGER